MEEEEEEEEAGEGRKPTKEIDYRRIEAANYIANVSDGTSVCVCGWGGCVCV